MSAAFATFEPGDVRDLIADYPLAWVTTPEHAPPSLLPLLGEYDADGRLTHLLGHMGRRNPLHARLVQAPSATILVNGPQGYVSPAHADRRDWGPTWNYTQLVIDAQIVFLPDETDHALDALTFAMEGDRWTARELGSRYDGMASAIIAFRATVTSLTGRFKLGQDEAPETFAAIVERHPNPALVSWMRRFARDRG
ncbi:FMN-binding negative transcriptional regulator [Sphingomonas sp. R86520]|uniref:FMN-binding negative transcriptional regulator n=1 Tax=Sphingomonas sp. R86520 TaxID=3093859 RepID=UPI0036D29234